MQVMLSGAPPSMASPRQQTPDGSAIVTKPLLPGEKGRERGASDRIGSAVTGRRERLREDTLMHGDPVPPGIDTSRAHPARVYDYWLGGKDNFAADREAAEQALQAYPQLAQAVQA